MAIPEGVVNIGKGAFQANALERVEISNSVKTIGNYAFRENKLISVTIPESVISIGEGIFQACEGLAEIIVNDKNVNYCSIDGNLYDKNATTLIQYAIGKNEKSFTIPNSVQKVGELSFCACKLETIIFSDSVTSIGEYAFYACKNLTSITLGKNVKSISSHAFYKCISLEKLEISEGLTYIHEQAFDSCSGLKNISVSEQNTKFASLQGNVYNKDFTSLILYAKGKEETSFTIPDGVTVIANRAFIDCENLTQVTIPNSVNNIEEFAFFSCENLEKMIYNGTKAQWKEVKKGRLWGNVQVQCIDGNLSAYEA